MKYTLSTFLLWLSTFYMVHAQQMPLRLIATSAATYDGSGLGLQDTTFLKYSGTRGDSNGLGRPHYDELVHWQRLTAAAPWQKVDRTLQSFDAGEHLVAALTQAWDTVAAAWQADKRHVWAYNAAGKLSGDTTANWNGATWVPQTGLGYTWNGAGQLSLWVKSLWNPNASAWYWDSRCWYYYDAAGKDSAIIHQVWDVNTASWINTERTINHYDAAGRLVLDQHDTWGTSPAGWEQGYLFHHAWTATGKPAGETLLSWNNNWDTLTQKVWQWNGAGDTAQVTYDAFSPAGRMKVSNDTWAYNADGSPALHVVTAWYAPGGVYRTLKRELYAWNAVHRQTELRTETWNNGGWQVTPADYRYRFYYETTGQPAGIRALSAGNDFRVYPVPAQTTLTVAVDDLQKDGLLQVTDAGGRVLRRQAVPAGHNVRTEVPVAELPAGTYWLTLFRSEGRVVKGFTIVR